jgi:hypothetical protein
MRQKNTEGERREDYRLVQDPDNSEIVIQKESMCELLYSSEIVIETPNKSNQSNLELTISVTRHNT